MSDGRQPYRVLIVDDSSDTIRLIGGVLQDDYDLLVATDGASALRIASDPATRPHLILLDVIMPGINGYEVCERLKRDPVTVDIPVIFTTILDEAQDETRGLLMGAVDYIGKPFNADILRARVKTHVDLKRHRDELELMVRERTAELEQANQERADALRSRSEFLSCLSHELRTPMNGVVSISDYLLHRGCDEKETRLLRMVRAAAVAQTRLLEDIISFSKLEKGKFKLTEGEFYLAYVLRTVEDVFTPSIHEKNLKLTLEQGEGCDRPLWGDARVLQQILMNLVGNAVKFSDQGEIRIRCGPEPIAPDQVRLRFAISDQGIGISEEKRELIFEEFTQGDSSSTRRYEGLGMGLSLVKRLVHLLSGDISLTSVSGEGSTFEFSVILRQPGATTA